jgi:translation initiation factor 3 subunit E
MWGKLVADILEGSWDAALGELDLLRKYIDNHYPWESRNSVVGLQQRTWFLHWSLFVYFNHAEGREKLVDAWMSQTAIGSSMGGQQQQHVMFYLPALQANAPHLLRYLVAAAIISRRAAFKGATYLGPHSRIVSREHLGVAVLNAVKQERYQYSDPITEFVRSLFADLNFEAAAKHLRDAERVCAADFFLANFKDEFIERARWLFSEAFCRVHHRIDIAYVSVCAVYQVAAG